MPSVSGQLRDDGNTPNSEADGLPRLPPDPDQPIAPSAACPGRPHTWQPGGAGQPPIFTSTDLR
ncbi:hypothetical protein B0T17DRAFT_544282, partial [Bombardia bombarda]